MGSMGHDNESFFIEHWVDDDDGTGSTMRRFSTSLWKRLAATVVKDIPAERQKVVIINGRYMTFDSEVWAEAEAEWTSG
jgi:hypothetical protein